MRSPTVASFLMTRVSSLTPSVLDHVCLPTTVQGIAAALEAEFEAEQLRPDLEEALYHMVPQLDEQTGLRRIVLSLRRSVHNGRPFHLAGDVLESIRGGLQEPLRINLNRWLDAQSRRETALQRSADALEAELMQASGVLGNAMQEAPLQRALALLSADFLRSIPAKKAPRDWLPRTRLGRTAMSYLARAAVKTSPFSTLTQVTAAYYDRAAQPGDTHTVVTLRRDLCLRLLQACARDPEMAAALRYEPGRNHWPTRRGTTILTPVYEMSGELTGRPERLQALKSESQLLSALSSFTGGTYADLLTVLSPEAGHTAIVQLLVHGLVQPVAPWRHHDLAPLRSLADALRQVPRDRAAKVAQLLDQMEDVSAQVGAATGSQRLELLDALRTATQAIFVHLRQPAPSWIEQVNLVYEDVRAAGPVPALGHHVQEDMLRLAQTCRFIRAASYNVVLQRFVSRFGSGGECQDLLAFLSDFLTDPEQWRSLQESWALDGKALERGTSDWDYYTGPSAAPPTAGILFQLAAPSHQDVLAGNYLLVVNHYMAGLGGLMARFAPLFAQPGDLTAALQDWVAALYPGAEIVDFPLMSDCNNLQLGLPMTGKVLQWPTETPCAGPRASLPLNDLRLRHDAANNVLVLEGPESNPLAPAYLGVVPDYVIGGPVRILLTILNPWLSVNAFRKIYERMNAKLPSAVQYQPRIQDGRIVFRRASWRMPPKDFPLPQKAETDLQYLCRVRRWQQQHQIPDEVYVTAEYQGITFEARKRKPMWLNFSSLHALHAVRHLVEGAPVAINLVEALPGRTFHWLQGEDGAMRASEFLTFIRWPAEAEEARVCKMTVAGSIS